MAAILAAQVAQDVAIHVQVPVVEPAMVVVNQIAMVALHVQDYVTQNVVQDVGQVVPIVAMVLKQKLFK